MKLVKVACLVTAMISGGAFAQSEVDGSNLAQSAPTGAKKYSAISYQQVQMEKGDAKTTSDWYGVKVGGLKVSVSDDHYHSAYQASLATNLGEILDLGKEPASAWGLLSKIQLEGGVASNKPSYALVGTELKLQSPFTLFLAGVYNDGSYTMRPIGGPIYYWSQSHSMLLFYPTTDAKSPTKFSAMLRNRVREMGDGFWIDLDVGYKVVKIDDVVKGRASYGAAVGLWKVALAYRMDPNYEGTAYDKKTVEVSYLYNL